MIILLIIIVYILIIILNLKYYKKYTDFTMNAAITMSLFWIIMLPTLILQSLLEYIYKKI